MEGIYKNKPSVANIGIMIFYNSMKDQGCETVQIDWLPPYKQPDDIEKLLEIYL